MANKHDSALLDSPHTTKSGSVIKPTLLLHLAYRNLVFKKLRTALTITGVVIGIGAIVFLLAFGFGLQDLVNKQVVGSSSVQTIDVTSPNSKLLKLNPSTVSQISNISNVTEVGKSYSAAGKVKLSSSQTESVVYGADHNFIELSTLKLNSGKIFEDSRTDAILVDSPLVKALGIPSDQKAVGQKATVSFDIIDSKGAKKTITKELTIVGVYQSDGQAESFVNSALVEGQGLTDATQLKLVAKNKGSVAQIRKSVDPLGFTTVSPLDTIDQINQVFNLLHFVLIGFGGIGIVIAILGMFNTLTISLLERTREIGLMISLGARKQDIKRLFIIEALMLSLLGGLFGLIDAIILGSIGNILLSSYAHHNGVVGNVKVFIVSPGLFFATLVMSIAIGLVVVYFPARRASQINPIDALKFE